MKDSWCVAHRLTLQRHNTNNTVQQQQKNHYPQSLQAQSEHSLNMQLSRKVSEPFEFLNESQALKYSN